MSDLSRYDISNKSKNETLEDIIIKNVKRLAADNVEKSRHIENLEDVIRKQDRRIEDRLGDYYRVGREMKIWRLGFFCALLCSLLLMLLLLDCLGLTVTLNRG